MDTKLMADALGTFRSLASEIHEGQSTLTRFTAYTLPDPPTRLRALAAAGALLAADVTHQHSGPIGEDQFWYFDNSAPEELPPDDMAALRLYVAALNDDPNLGWDVLFAHEDATGSTGVVGVIKALIALYSAMALEVHS